MAQPKALDSLNGLIARCALGDRTAFVSLYRKTAPNLYGIALRILQREAWAEEALQDSFMRIWFNADRYDPGKGNPMPWLISIVRNRALDLRRKAEYRVQEVEWSGDADPRVSADNPSKQAEISQGLARVRHCLALLSKQQRQAILLMYHQGFTPTELANSLGVSVNTVKTWVRRGLARLRECLRA